MLLTTALATIAAPVALSQSSANPAPAYPHRPVRLIVPFAAGGDADIVARELGQKLNETYRQPVVVDNLGGGNGIGGTEVVAKASADGYTLLMATSSHVINPGFAAKLPFDAVKDFAPVTQVTTQALRSKRAVRPHDGPVWTHAPSAIQSGGSRRT